MNAGLHLHAGHAKAKTRAIHRRVIFGTIMILINKMHHIRSQGFTNKEGLKMSKIILELVFCILTNLMGYFAKHNDSKPM